MKNIYLKKENSKGFTLIELLVVIAIIGLLSSIVMASLASARNKATDSVLVQGIKQLQVAFEMYKDDVGSYPFQVVLPAFCEGDSYCTNQANPGDTSALEFSILPVLVPKYISSLEYLFDGVPDQYYLGAPSIYYIMKPDSYVGTGIELCGDLPYTDDQYILAIYKYHENGRQINLPLETWGYDGNYYCVTP